MSRLFYAVNRETGERWKPITEGRYMAPPEEHYLVMYDSGMVAEVSSYYYETNVTPLCNKTWKIVFNESMQSKIDKSEEK